MTCNMRCKLSYGSPYSDAYSAISSGQPATDYVRKKLHSASLLALRERHMTLRYLKTAVESQTIFKSVLGTTHHVHLKHEESKWKKIAMLRLRRLQRGVGKHLWRPGGAIARSLRREFESNCTVLWTDVRTQEKNSCAIRPPTTPRLEK